MSETPEEPAAVWVPLDQLKPWDKNPRVNDHAVDRVAESIKRFGFGAPILARRADGEIIAGHTRLKAARKLRLERVPVRYLDPADAHLMALADNKLGEIAEWDDEELATVLRELQAEDMDIDVAGFDADELEEILGSGEPDGTGGEDPGAAEPPANPQSKRGEIYKLGPHRLLCGDSTDLADVQRLLGGEKAKLYATDPPYLVDYDGKRPGDSGKDWSAVYHEIDIKDANGFFTKVFTNVLAVLDEHAASYCWYVYRVTGDRRAREIFDGERERTVYAADLADGRTLVLPPESLDGAVLALALRLPRDAVAPHAKWTIREAYPGHQALFRSAPRPPFAVEGAGHLAAAKGPALELHQVVEVHPALLDQGPVDRATVTVDSVFDQEKGAVTSAAFTVAWPSSSGVQAGSYAGKIELARPLPLDTTALARDAAAPPASQQIPPHLQAQLDAHSNPSHPTSPGPTAPGHTQGPAQTPGGPGQTQGTQGTKGPGGTPAHQGAPALEGARTGKADIMAGQQGPQVKELQKELNQALHLNPPLPETGKMDQKTIDAVKQLQQRSGCKVDGIVGPETMAVLDKALGATPNPAAAAAHKQLHPQQPTKPGQHPPADVWPNLQPQPPPAPATPGHPATPGRPSTPTPPHQPPRTPPHHP